MVSHLVIVQQLLAKGVPELRVVVDSVVANLINVELHPSGGTGQG